MRAQGKVDPDSGMEPLEASDTVADTAFNRSVKLSWAEKILFGKTVFRFSTVSSETPQTILDF